MSFAITNTLFSFDTGVQLSGKELSWLTLGKHDETAGRKSFKSWVFKCKETRGTINLFSTGKGVIGGLNSDFHTRLTADWACYLINRHATRDDQARLATVTPLKADNDVYHMNLGKAVDIYRLHRDYKSIAVIDEKPFNKVRLVTDGYTISVYPSGKVGLIGVQDRSLVARLNVTLPDMLSKYMIV